MSKSTAAEPALSKAGFIRQFPTDTPADDVVALGAEAGLTLTKKMVWTVQSELRHPKKASSKKPSSSSKKKATKKAAKKPTKKAAAKKSAKKTAKKKAAPKPTATKAAEQRLKALILQVGLARAEAVYDQLREQLDALLD
jgi:hypothetical protein